MRLPYLRPTIGRGFSSRFLLRIKGPHDHDTEQGSYHPLRPLWCQEQSGTLDNNAGGTPPYPLHVVVEAGTHHKGRIQATKKGRPS